LQAGILSSNYSPGAPAPSNLHFGTNTTAQIEESWDGQVNSGMMESKRRPYPAFFWYLGYTIFSIFLAAAILEIGSAVVRHAYHWIQPGLAPAPASPAYQGYPWAEEFWKEEYLRRGSAYEDRYVPFLIWGEKPWHREYINVDDSFMGNLRRTANPLSPACNQAPRKVIWMFGGSTIFGFGVPDAETVPSHLSRELNSSGPACFVILNAGVEGYVTNQELLLEALKTGQRPDMVIFYDGANEGEAATSPEIQVPHLEFERVKARIEGTLPSKLDFVQNSNSLGLARAIGRRFKRNRSSAAPPADLAARAAAALDNYEANTRVVRSLGQAYNFKVFCFWQPSLAFDGKPLAPFEQQLQRHILDSKSFKILKAVNEEAARRSLRGGDFVFLGQVFDSVKEPLYIDQYMHLGPRGNRIVAQAIAKWVDGHAEN
jgi:lysophospholipase L1-like esterase